MTRPHYCFCLFMMLAFVALSGCQRENTEEIESISAPAITILHHETDSGEGKKLEQMLEKQKIGVVYAESVEEIAENSIVFSFFDDELDREKTTTTLDGHETARVLFTVTPDSDYYPLLEQIAIEIEERYPGIPRGLILSEEQGLSDEVIYIAVGGPENTAAEKESTIAILSDYFVHYFAE
ncbi:stage II sporulation protein P [Alkalihalobacillus oceani]|uniref:Stage II sporulation protein P n=1 Tax=Halalkalibacter oceani TaxID=1653776 RepID=A0A9X2DSH5_9BACI|nr:stage II sporulation protein P [Halalkalibacter oceani]MCM3714760.1 stage II sporulation protein P [Halalkalibacter oceani]